MAVAFFVVPLVGAGTMADPIRAKYTAAPEVVRDGMIRFSRQDEAIAMIEATPAYLSSVANETDTILICVRADLDTVLTAQQRTGTQNQLEARGIPAQWVNAGDTWRNVIRGVCGIFLFSQRVEGRTGHGIRWHLQQGNIALSDAWSELPQGAKNLLLETAQSFGWSNPGFTNQSTLREILWWMSSQFENTEIIIGGERV